MPTHVRPVQGRWYYDTERRQSLRVTWVDDDETLVEARFEDGRTEQFPQAAWMDLRLEPQQSPPEGEDPAHAMRPAPRGESMSDEEFRRALGFPDGREH